MKTIYQHFSPRKEPSFFRQARRIFIPGGVIFTKRNSGITRIALHVAKTSTSVKKNAIKRELRENINHLISSKRLADQDIFFSITNWEKASGHLNSTF